MYVFQASATVPFMSIPSPTGFLVLKVRRILVHAFLASHLTLEGFGEFHGVSGDSDEMFLGSFVS